MGHKIFTDGKETSFAWVVNAFGSQQISVDPALIISDTFDGAGLDTTNRWTAAGTVIPTQPSGGFALINPGTAASASSSLVSQASPIPTALQMLVFDVSLETTTIATGNHRFWGVGTQPGSWTAATPLQDAIGFEVTTGGVLRAVVYSAGSVAFASALTVPVDGASHRHLVLYRPGVAFYFLDNVEVPVAFTPVFPSVQALPVRVHSINGLSTTVGTPTLQCNNAVMLDFTMSSSAISDGQYPWRKASVRQASSSSLPTDSAVVSTTRGGSSFSLSSAATTNATSISAVAANLYSLNASNAGGAPAFVKLYNKASAPTVGTDVPVLSISVPSTGSVSVPFSDLGYRFSTGIALAITNLAGDSDATAVTAGQLKVAATYL